MYGAPQQPPVDPVLWGYFQAADTNRSGQIDCRELQRCLSNGSWAPFNLDTIKLMIGLFDRDRSGTINFQEFTGVWRYINDWSRVFQSYDRDRSLSIDSNELATCLRQFGYSVSPQFVALLVYKFDRSGSRTISFDDFIQICILMQNLTNKFRQFDTQRNGFATFGYEQFLSIFFETRP